MAASSGCSTEVLVVILTSLQLIPMPNLTGTHRMSTSHSPVGISNIRNGTASVTTGYFPPDIPAITISIVLGFRDPVEKLLWGVVREGIARVWVFQSTHAIHTFRK